MLLLLLITPYTLCIFIYVFLSPSHSSLKSLNLKLCYTRVFQKACCYVSGSQGWKLPSKYNNLRTADITSVADSHETTLLQQ
jgi:hypothetical protein